MRDREWLARQLEAGRAASEIARGFGVTVQAVEYWRVKHGIPPRAAQRTYRNLLWSGDWFLYQYQELNRTDAEIARELGVSTSAVKHWRRKHGVRARPAKPRFKRLRDLPLALDADVAYLLGWLYSDGSVTKAGISIGVSPEDAELMYSFATRFGGNVLVEPRYVRWTLYSQEVVKWLEEEFGVSPGAKSRSMPPVPLLPSELMPHFARGYFDGDGTVFLQGRYLVAGLASADEDFLVSLCDMFPAKWRVTVDKTPRGRPFYQAHSRSRDAVANMEWMACGGAGLRLERKWQKYDDLKRKARLHTRPTPWNSARGKGRVCGGFPVGSEGGC